MTWTLVTEYATQYHQSPNPFRPWRPGNRLRYRIPIGATLVRIGGHWQAVTGPSEAFLATGDLYYRGGGIHTVSDDVAAELIADGFEDFVTED